jgi:hypothetical protein
MLQSQKVQKAYLRALEVRFYLTVSKGKSREILKRYEKCILIYFNLQVCSLYSLCTVHGCAIDWKTVHFTKTASPKIHQTSLGTQHWALSKNL